MKKISIIVLFAFILSNAAYGAGDSLHKTSLRPEMVFGKGGAGSRFITHQKDSNGSDVWRIPAWYAESRVAPELVDLFSAAEKLEISRFKIGGGTARDFCLGVFFGIRTIDKSSDIDVIIPGIEKFDNLWGFLEEFQKIAMGKRGLERFPCIDIVLGWAPPEEKRMVYESLYVEGDLSITKLVIEKEQEFYIITDSYGGVSDIRDKILRFVNMTGAQFSAERVMNRYIPYFAKLKQHGFKYEPASKKRIDDFLQEGRFSMADILRGINSVFDKASSSDAVFAALQEFKLLDILKRQTDGLDAQSDSNIVSELRGFIGRVRNRETIDPEALSDFIERLCKAIEGRAGRSGVSDVYRQALLRPEMAFGKGRMGGRNLSAEEVFRKIKVAERNILTAEMIDELGVNEEDDILHVGPADFEEHAVACAIKGAKVDIVQPAEDALFSYEPEFTQMNLLRRNIEDSRRLIIENYQNDLIGNRIDTQSYEGYIGQVNLSLKHYSYVFLLDVLERIAEDSQEEFMDRVFACIRDEAHIIFSAFPADLELTGINTLRIYAARLGYRFDPKIRIFIDRGQNVYALKVFRNPKVEILPKLPAGQAL